MLGSIAETLKRFNRKERFWVVQNALGRRAVNPSQDFCDRLTANLPGLGPMKSAETMWAMDYHFDWLHAALRWHCDGPWAEDHQPEPKGDLLDRESWTIRGQQEDVDLLVAHDQDVVLVEAKAFGGWSEPQLLRKLRRLSLLGANPDGRVCSVASPLEQLVHLHFACLSPKAPPDLEPPDGIDAAHTWPWSQCKTSSQGIARQLPWTELQVELDRERILRVVQCDATGNALGGGSHWRIR